jgi:hypothetical protein
MFGSAPVTAELREWLRLTPRHPRYDRDGLTDRTLALSTVEAFALRTAVSRPVHAVGRRLGLPALLAAASTVEGAVFVLTGDDPVAAGRRLMRTWLTLGREGIAVHPLSQLLDCPHTARAVTAMVDGTPLAIFRAGRPVTPPPRSARLPAPRQPSRTSMDG